VNTFQLGAYTVTQRYEADLYRVFLRSVLIGKCYSRPCESDCAWLERQMREQTGYAYSASKLPELTEKRRGKAHRHYAEPWNKKKRNRKVGAPRKPETIRDIAKALACG